MRIASPRKKFSITVPLLSGLFILAAAPTSQLQATGSNPPIIPPVVVHPLGGVYSDSVAIADLNGDGHQDLVVASQCQSSDCSNDSIVSVLLGNGKGAFHAPVNYTPGGIYTRSVAIADVNGDGHPDLVVASQCQSSDCSNGGTVSVLLGNGDGTFQAAVTYLGGYDADFVAIADVNHDGHPDLVVADFGQSSSSNTGALSVLLGNGDGTFDAPVSYLSGGLGATAVAIGDVNGDGDPDLVVSNWCQSSGCPQGGVSVLLGNGDGSFQAPVTYSSGGFEPTSIAIGDLNGDGHLDLVATNVCQDQNRRCGGVGVLLGNGDGTFQTAISYLGAYYPTSVAIGDVNGDGYPDLVVASSCQGSNCNNGGVSVLLGYGDGTFQETVSYSSGGINATSVAIADVNADGRADIAVANYCATLECSSGSMGVLLNHTAVGTTSRVDLHTITFSASNRGW